MNVIKILGNSITLSGVGTTVADLNGLGAQYVLIQHTGSGKHFITQKTGAGTTIGSINLPPDSLITIKKERTDTLEVDSGNDIHVTAVVYQG